MSRSYKKQPIIKEICCKKEEKRKTRRMFKNLKKDFGEGSFYKKTQKTRNWLSDSYTFYSSLEEYSENFDYIEERRIERAKNLVEIYQGYLDYIYDELKKDKGFIDWENHLDSFLVKGFRYDLEKIIRYCEKKLSKYKNIQEKNVKDDYEKVKRSFISK